MGHPVDRIRETSDRIFVLSVCHSANAFTAETSFSLSPSDPVDHAPGLVGLLLVQHPDVPHRRGLVREPPVAEAAAVGLRARVRHGVPLQHPARVELGVNSIELLKICLKIS